MVEAGNHEVQDAVIVDNKVYMESRVLAWELHRKHKDILGMIRRTSHDYLETYYLDKQGKKRTSYLVSRDGFLCLASIVRVPPEVKMRIAHRYSTAETFGCTQNHIDELEQAIRDSGLIRPWVNPRYQLDHMKAMYKDKTGDDTPRGFYDSIGDWIGISIPYSSTIKITVRDWIIENIPMEKIKEFVSGVCSDTIVRSETGHWVHLGGFDNNTVEWDKMVKEFHGKCAYCGEEKPLLPEHLVPQTELSKEHPERVDRIANVVPSCAECNHSKLRNDWESWYRTRRYFSESRYKAIKRHIKKYKLKGDE